MSRIFDALQRSESERSGSDPASMPEGPELLNQAERHTLSKWYDSPAQEEVPALQIPGLDTLRGPGITLADIPKIVDSPESAPAPIDDRRSFFAQLKSMPISLSEQSRLVCLTEKESATAEALRLLGVRLRDLRRTKTLKKVLITSTIPQEGKSTIAANLACALAHTSEERTLLIEGDLRRPSLSKMFGVHAKHGICDSLGDEMPALQCIYQLKDANLWLLPAGTAPANPLELMQSSKLPQFMNELARYFDWIVIDSPPVLPLADTSIWMRLADGILLVTRQGITQKLQLQKGLEALDPQKTLGAVVNSSVASAYSGYYYRSSSLS